MADFEEGSLSTFLNVLPDTSIVGYWFHYAQAPMKRCNKIGLKEPYGLDIDAMNIVYCLMSPPLVPLTDITDAVSELQEQVNISKVNANQLQQPISYIQCH